MRSLDVTCELCHHTAVLNVDRFGDDVSVPAFGPRMVCTYCGIIGGVRAAKLTIVGKPHREAAALMPVKRKGPPEAQLVIEGGRPSTCIAGNLSANQRD